MRATLVLPVLALVTACSSGGTAPSGNPPPLGGRDVPSFLRDSPGSSRETPSGGRESPAPSSTPAPTGGNTCIRCNTVYTCTVSGQTTELDAKSQPGGWCGTPQGGVACGGVVVDGNGAADGTWTSLPNGGFRICTLDGDCSITCTPGAQLDAGPTPLPPTPG